jgi:hypothetical protein
MLAVDILTAIQVSFVVPAVREVVGLTHVSLVGYLVITIFFSKAWVRWSKCGKGVLAPAGRDSLCPSEIKVVVADMIG